MATDCIPSLTLKFHQKNLPARPARPRKVRHELLDLLRQRVFGLVCGYEDGDDAVRLADDPKHTMAVARAPLTEAALASQPTRSRFENAMGPLAWIGWAGRWARRSSRSIDPAHGACPADYARSGSD